MTSHGRHSVSNHRQLDYLFNRLFRRTSKKTSKLRVTDLCERNSPVTSGFPSQRASNAENVSIWWRHHTDLSIPCHFRTFTSCLFFKFCRNGAKIRPVFCSTQPSVHNTNQRNIAKCIIYNMLILLADKNAPRHFSPVGTPQVSV